MELEAVVPPPPPPSDKQNLPKDFQDALSIIFDRGAEKSTSDDAPAAAEGENSNEITHVVMQDDTSTFAAMEMSSMDSQPSHVDYEQANAAVIGTVNMELDDHSQYMLYEEHYVQNHVHQPPHAVSTTEAQSLDMTAQSIPAPPIQMLDAAGNLTQIPGPVLPVSSDFVMLDPDGNRIDNYTIGKNDAGPKEIEHGIDLQNKRKQQELDDLAMLGIDADDLAAQCI